MTNLTYWTTYITKYLVTNANGSSIQRLRNLSGNCSILFLKTKFKDHFLKFQVNHADDVIGDNIHNWLLNQVFQKKETYMKKYITTFIDSFPVNLRKLNDQQYNVDITKHIENSNQICNVNIQEKLVAIELNHIPQSHFATPVFQQSFLNLMKMLQHLGNEYSFSHNDAHLGNIMMQKDGTFVLIDYGRCVFNQDNDTIKDLLMHSEIVDMKTKLDKSTFEYKTLLESNYIQPHKSHFMLDISTITMLLLTKSENPSSLLGDKMHFEYRIADNYVKTIKIKIDKTRNNLSDIIYNLMHSSTKNIFIPGLYTFIKFVELNCPRFLRIDGNIFTVHFNMIVQEGYIWSSFQYLYNLNLNNDDILTKLVVYLQNIPEQIPIPPQIPINIDWSSPMDISQTPRRATPPTPMDISPRYIPQKYVMPTLWKALYDELVQKVHKWNIQNDTYALGYFSEVSEPDFTNYIEFSTKVRQCLRMMTYALEFTTFQSLGQLALDIVNACCSGGVDELNEYRARFEALKRIVLLTYNTKNQQGGLLQPNALSKLEQNAIQSINEHFILGYDTPPSKKTWDIATNYYYPKIQKK